MENGSELMRFIEPYTSDPTVSMFIVIVAIVWVLNAFAVKSDK